MLNKEGIALKRGQIHEDESGQHWVYWGAVREYYDNPKSIYGRVSRSSKTLGIFYEIGKEPKGYWAPHHETRRVDLLYDKVTFVAQNLKGLALVKSGVDIKLIDLLNKLIKDIKNLVNANDEEWTYDAIVYWMHGLERFVNCLNELKPDVANVCNGHYQVNSVLEPRLKNDELKSKLIDPINNANEQTIIELKKIAKTIEKERTKVLDDFGVKRKYVEGYIEKYYNHPETEFLNSLISWDIINGLDFKKYGLSISDVKVEVKVNESCMGNIQYWSYRNVGSANINGHVFTGDFYSNKSHGWNWDN